MIIISKLARKIHYWMKLFCLMTIIWQLNACTSMHLNMSNSPRLPSSSRLMVGPLANHSDTPLANRQVESILVGLLQTRGFQNILPYPRPQSCEKLLYCADESVTNARLIRWGRQHKIHFILTGSTNEWRYKVGLDGEPVAGVSLILINVKTGKTIWTGVGSIIGNSRSGLELVGQRLLVSLVNNLIVY